MQKSITVFTEDILKVCAGNNLLRYIVNTCVSVSVLIIFLIFIRGLFMKKLPRMGMYVLWFAVLIRIVCPFTVHGIYSVLPERVEKMAVRIGHGWMLERAEFPSERDVLDKCYDGMENGSGLPDPMESHLLRTEREKQTKADVSEQQEEWKEVEHMRLTAKVGIEKKETLAARAETESETRPYASNGTAVWLLVLWGVGVFWCLCYETVSMLRMKWRFRDAEQIYGNVYTHPLVFGSFVAGIFSPKIYVPERLEGEEWKYVLRHERVHIRRRDHILKPLAFSLLSLLWFNPLVWIAYFFMMRDMEVSCDERVIRDLPAEERKKYSYLLLAMSGGQNLPSHTPAFGAGEVRERIRNVLKFKKPTRFVSVLAAVSVILCGCGVVSVPEATKQPVSVAEKISYREQDMLLQDHYQSPFHSKYSSYPNEEFIVDPQGKFVCFRTMCILSDKEGREIWIEKCIGAKEEFKESEFQQPEYQEPSWGKEYEKRFPDARYWLERYKYGADGYLYLYVAEYSMDRLKYWAKYLEKPDSPLERIKNHLMKVDEQTGEMTEIVLPEQEKRQVEGSGTAAYAIPGVRRLEFAVSSNGNILLAKEGQNSGAIYDAFGQRLSDVSFENRTSDVYSGTGFWAYVTKNQATKKMDVNVLDEDGDLLYTIRTGVEDDGSRDLKMALGTKEDEILMVCWEGIYEAKFNEKKFRYVAGYETDRFYCLWPKYSGLELSNIYKGEQGDYYVGMRYTLEQSDDDFYISDYGKQEPWYTGEVYHYTKKEEE